MTTTSKSYADYVVLVESKALRGRSKQEYLGQVRKRGEHYVRRELAGEKGKGIEKMTCSRQEAQGVPACRLQ
jgi:hypothetical protein